MNVLPTLLRFLGTGLLWGSSFMWISIALESFSWQFLTWVRAPLGLATLGVILAVRQPKNSNGKILPHDKKLWLQFALIGFTFTALPSTLYTLSLGGISSSTVSIYSATAPFFTALIAGLIFKTEKLNRFNWLGISIGVIGVVFVVEPWTQGAEATLGSELAVLAAVLSVAFAYVYQKQIMVTLDANPVVVSFMITAGASVFSLLATPWVMVAPINFNPESVAALLILGVGSGAIGYVWNAEVVHAWGATAGSMVAYLSPVVGVIAGSLVLGEEFTWSAAVGVLIISAAIAIDRMPNTVAARAEK